ncbi:MAG: hypothetical protein JW800_05320 [Candidatus Omnitrophica bacterium]|nr:hypothetical protein [Candidatus Omnitrophota bacterium]
MKDESVKLLNKKPHRNKQKKRLITAKEVAVILFMVVLAIFICYVMNPKYPVLREHREGASFLDRIVMDRAMKILNDKQYQNQLRKEYENKDSKHLPF